MFACGVLGHLAPVYLCPRSLRCVVRAVSWATWLLFTGVIAPCVVLRVWCPGPLGSYSPVCSLGVLCCVCGVLGHLAPVKRCVRSVDGVACAVSSAIWLLFTGVLAPCVVLCVRCPGPLGSCSPVYSLGMLCCLCGVLGHLSPVQRCVCSVGCVACAVSWAIWLLFTGVLAPCVVLRVWCPGGLGSCSPLCSLGMLCCLCGVLGYLAPVHCGARSVRCLACVVSRATWLLFTCVLAPCVVLSVRYPGPLGSCSPVCSLSGLCRVCRVLGHLTPVHRSARSVRCVACVASRATWFLFTGVLAQRVVLRVRRPAPLGSCSPTCSLGVLCCVCGVLGHLAPVHWCVRSVNGVACAVSVATSGVRTQRHTHPNTPARGGGTQPKPEPKHTHPHRATQPGMVGYKRSAHANTHTHTNTRARSGRPQPKPEPKHTHPHRTRKPGVAGYKRRAHTNTHTPQHPSQEWRGAA